MSGTRAAVLATLLEATFEEFADMYADALEDGGGLENVIAQLRQIQADDQ